MDGLNEATKTVEQSQGFINHVFKFDDSSKKELLNIIQYAILSIIPIVTMNKSIQKFMPDADEEKGSIEILAEVITQLVVIFLGMFFIHRIVVYIPTYSKMNYENFSVVNIIMAFMVIVLSLQTKLGLKVNILADRIIELVEGPSDKPKESSRSNPQSQENNNQPTVAHPTHQVSRSDFLNANDFKVPTDLRGMPPPGNIPGPPSAIQTKPVMQQNPDFNSMYAGPQNPLQNANLPGQSRGGIEQAPQMGGAPPSSGQIGGGGMLEPMAANDFLGGAFGSPF